MRGVFRGKLRGWRFGNVSIKVDSKRNGIRLLVWVVGRDWTGRPVAFCCLCLTEHKVGGRESEGMRAPEIK